MVKGKAGVSATRRHGVWAKGRHGDTATPPGLESPENDHILGDATRTHGSNPARISVI